MKAAIKSDWQANEFPTAVHELLFNREFSDEELLLMQLGLVPFQMEDKWFIYYENDVVHFHRSWTGNKIFELTLSASNDKTVVSKALVNCDPAEYTQQDDNYNISLLNYLIDRLLLNKEVAFPAVQNFDNKMQALHQHSTIGHGRSNKEIDHSS